MRRSLDFLYSASGAAAALSLAGVFVVMLAQALGREVGVLVRGADDLSAWLTAAAAFFALGHTFRHGELVRMGLVIESLPPRARWCAELAALTITALFTAWMAWAVVFFVYDSWRFHEVAQGLIKIPIWIPQLTFVVGMLIFLIAVLDDLVAVLRRQKPAYQLAEEERRARGDFSELT
jgi:TRAP-type C4-dicarboxylate transport system permease small subunit